MPPITRPASQVAETPAVHLGYVAIYGNATDARKANGNIRWHDVEAIPSDVGASHAFVLASGTQMRFVPTADYNGSVSGGLHLRASDTTDTTARASLAVG